VAFILIKVKQKLFIILSILYFAINASFAQDANKYNGKYGGPFISYSQSKLGNTFVIGGGGIFLVNKSVFFGIFGQTSGVFLPIKSKLVNYTNYDVKSRYTGFFVGYFQSFKNADKFYLSYYSKVGFGQVYVDDKENNYTFYDSSILIEPNIEAVYSVTRFFKIGVGAFYSIYTGVDLLEYKNTDFNSYGLSINFRFLAS